MSMILRSTRDTLGLARTRKFLLGVSGSSILAYSSYHLLLDSKEKRKVRVYSSGVRRFARMVYLGVRVLADAQYRSLALPFLISSFLLSLSLNHVSSWILQSNNSLKLNELSVAENSFFFQHNL